MADQVAQLVEHIPFKDGVLGSNPSLVTIFSFSYLVVPHVKVKTQS